MDFFAAFVVLQNYFFAHSGDGVFFGFVNDDVLALEGDAAK